MGVTSRFKKLALHTKNILDDSKKEKKKEIIKVLEEIMEECFYNLEVGRPR